MEQLTVNLDVDFLKHSDARISYKDKWLVWFRSPPYNVKEFNNKWCVFEEKPRRKNSECLYAGDSFDMALAILSDGYGDLENQEDCPMKLK
jgi:hypothetical protein